MKAKQISVNDISILLTAPEETTNQSTSTDTATTNPWLAIACALFFPGVYMVGKLILALFS